MYSTSLLEEEPGYTQKETIELLCFPDPKLRKKSKDIIFEEEGEEYIRSLAEDMAFVMSELGGIGLAAPQIDVHKKMIVVDTQEGESNLSCFINPRIIDREGKVTTKERCLSVPEMEISVTRSKNIRLQFKDMQGNSHVKGFKDLMSICIQHELDHLDGKIIIDYIAS